MSTSRISQIVEEADDIASFKADMTVRTSVAAKYLDELGVKAIPLLVIDGPGLDNPILSEYYTVEDVINMIEKARGTNNLTAQKTE